MDHFDNESLSRVWQRVHPSETSSIPQSQLADLLYWERCLVATYQQLLRHFKGNPKMLLHKLYQQKRSSIACLQGIYTLLDGKRPALPRANPHWGNIQTVLRRCYRDGLRCASLYEQHSSHPEYGYAFTQLARQSRLHCQTLLQLLGAIS